MRNSPTQKNTLLDRRARNAKRKQSIDRDNISLSGVALDVMTVTKIELHMQQQSNNFMHCYMMIDIMMRIYQEKWMCDDENELKKMSMIQHHYV